MVGRPSRTGGKFCSEPPQVEVDPMRHVSTCNSVRRLSREGTLVDTGQLATAPGLPNPEMTGHGARRPGGRWGIRRRPRG